MTHKILLIPAAFCLLGFSSYIGFDNNATPVEQQQQAIEQSMQHWDGMAYDRDKLTYFPEDSEEGQIPEALKDKLKNTGEEQIAGSFGH